MVKSHFWSLKGDLRRFLNLADHLLNKFALQTQNARHENKGRANSRYRVLILAGLSVMRRDISG